MFTVTFVGKSGASFIGTGRDLDRARCDAKRKAGKSWDMSAQPKKISCGGVQ